jgi:hypothetical protein
MTAIHRHTHALRPLPPPHDLTDVGDRHPIAAPPLDGLILSWDVLPDLPALAPFTPTPAALTHARLVIGLRQDSLHAALELAHKGASSPSRIPLPTTDAPITLSFERTPDSYTADFAHINAPGVLTATIAIHRDHTPRALYARTPLLRSLGLPGGGYDRPAAAWDTGASSKP